MRAPLEAFYKFLDRPMFFSARVVLVALAIPLALSYMQPLWRISMEAPQYPKGLYLDIFAYKLEGGDDGQHIDEINTLNHYIGMHKLDRAALSDLDWIPFALGALLLMALRVAAVGNVRALLDLFVMTMYVSGFAFARFIHKLYVFGHDLAKDAPVRVDPFMPVVFGTKQIANFTTHSFPQGGSYMLGTFVMGLTLLTIWHLWAGRREEKRELAAAKAAVVAG